MKKENNNIYDKLDDLKAPINKAKNWEELYHRDGFPKQKKNRRFFIWFFFGVSIFVLLTILVINFFNSESLPVNPEINSPSIAVETESSTASKPETTNSNSNKIVQANKNKIEKVNSTTKSIPKISQTSIRPPTSTRVEIYDNENKYSNTKLFHQDKPSEKITNLNELGTSTLTRKDKRDNQLTFSNPIDKNQINVRPPTPLRKNLAKQTTFLSYLPLTNKISKEDNRILSFDTSILLTKSAISPSPKKWAFETGIGLGISNHAIINDPAWEGQTFQNEHTEALISYAADLRIFRKFNHNFRLAIGLKYENHQRKFSYQDESIQYVKQPSTSPYQYLESTTITTYNYYHKHHIIDLASIFIKDFTWNRTTAYLGIGGGINLLSSFSGKGIDTTLSEVEIQNAADYRSSLGWHFLYEVGFTQQFNHHSYFQISLSGKSRKNLNTRGSHRISPLNVRVGVGKNF